jgi:hypothetical protein
MRDPHKLEQWSPENIAGKEPSKLGQYAMLFAGKPIEPLYEAQIRVVADIGWESTQVRENG